ncbi:MAG: (2Fe-2S)-binding protein [Gemmataceae bacterium]
MDLDARVCFCFHVTRRKLLSFLRTQRPRVATQMSQCGGAGTGCGWCVPFLKQMFDQRGTSELDHFTTEEYAQQRQAYLAAGKVRPTDPSPKEP